MIDAESTIRIARPVGDVFAFVSDCRNEPLWHTDVVAAEPLSDGPMGVGTRERWRMFGGRFENIMRVTEFAANARISLDGEKRTLGIHTRLTYTFTSTGGETDFSRRIRMQMTGIGRLLEPIYRIGAPRRNRTFLKNLKAVLEK